MAAAPRRKAQQRAGVDERVAGLCLLETYAGLAQQAGHLLGGLLAGQAPRQWAHYPENDAIDPRSGFQWFYHSHSPEDRPASSEHGHIHLFARRKLWSRRLRSAREVAFSALAGGFQPSVNTRHLLCIGFDPKGIPTTLFTVNSWVTGDLMLSAPTTMAILDQIKLNTGNTEVDAVIGCVIRLCKAEIRCLLEARDRLLLSRNAVDVLWDKNLEVLSELPIDIDRKLG